MANHPSALLIDAYLTSWPAEQGLWGIVLEYSDGTQHSYSVGNRQRASAELLSRLLEADAEDLLARVRRDLG